MKEQVNKAGVKRWWGNDFINMQNELRDALYPIFKELNVPDQNDGNIILHGVKTTDNGNGTHDISSGLVALYNSDQSKYKICEFEAVTNVTLPIYIILTEDSETRLYGDGTTKDITEIYSAETQGSEPTHSNFIKIQGDYNDDLRRFKNIKHAPLYVSPGDVTSLNDFAMDGDFRIYFGDLSDIPTITGLKGGFINVKTESLTGKIHQTLWTFGDNPYVFVRIYGGTLSPTWGSWVQIYPAITESVLESDLDDGSGNKATIKYTRTNISASTYQVTIHAIMGASFSGRSYNTIPTDYLPSASISNADRTGSHITLSLSPVAGAVQLYNSASGASSIISLTYLTSL